MVSIVTDLYHGERFFLQLSIFSSRDSETPCLHENQIEWLNFALFYQYCLFGAKKDQLYSFFHKQFSLFSAVQVGTAVETDNKCAQG
ncbi:unnamed protein product [Schistosoma haematobium]|nr:unnamed protein product [Schistosoma haematobium]